MQTSLSHCNFEHQDLAQAHQPGAHHTTPSGLKGIQDSDTEQQQDLARFVG